MMLRDVAYFNEVSSVMLVLIVFVYVHDFCGELTILRWLMWT